MIAPVAPPSLALSTELYGRFGSDLVRVREDQASLYDKWSGHPDRERWPSVEEAVRLYRAQPASPLRRSFYRVQGTLLRRRRAREIGLYPQFDDVEAELTYLYIRHLRPETVVEISPCGGYSTTWILSALRDNEYGHLYSYDVLDHSVHIVPDELKRERWTFIKGDARTASLPDGVDYLFIDSNHNGSFARWYIDKVFPRMSRAGFVSVDDIVQPPHVAMTGEAKVVLHWLRERKVQFFTASPSGEKGTFEAIMKCRRVLGIDTRIHDGVGNPAIFFANPSPVPDPRS